MRDEALVAIALAPVLVVIIRALWIRAARRPTEAQVREAATARHGMAFRAGQQLGRWLFETGVQARVAAGAGALATWCRTSGVLSFWLFATLDAAHFFRNDPGVAPFRFSDLGDVVAVFSHFRPEPPSWLPFPGMFDALVSSPALLGLPLAFFSLFMFFKVVAEGWQTSS